MTMDKTFRQFFLSVVVIASVIGLFKLYFDFQVPFARTGLKNIIGFYCFVVVFSTFLIETVFAVFKIKPSLKMNIRLVFVSITGALLLAEFGLRFFMVNATYIEHRDGCYLSSTNNDYDSLHIILPTYKNRLQSEDFDYSRIRNNEGFRDKAFECTQDTSAILIQTLGDSFTEGDGAPADSSYPAALRRLFQANQQHQLVVQNYGICGNDPGFYGIQLRNFGLKYHPKLWIMCYCCFDFTNDFFSRGGLERFSSHPMQGLQMPKWEIVYAYSFVFRLFIKAFSEKDPHCFFMTSMAIQQRQKALEPKWNEVFVQLNALAKANNVKILLVKKPEGNEVSNKKYAFDFSFFEKDLSKLSNIKTFDLLPYYLNTEHWDGNETKKYYWEHDGHHNGKGYEKMAKGIYTGLQEIYPELFLTTDSISLEKSMFVRQ